MDAEGAVKHIIGLLKHHMGGFALKAIVHRIVHGGEHYIQACQMTAEILDDLKALIPLAPLHQGHNLAALEFCHKLFADLPQIAAFDTGFHAHHAPLFTEFALDPTLKMTGVRRYGFHGLSYEWIAEVLHDQYANLYTGKVVIAHLGSGSSLCALKGGQSIDTTMGMTALDGLPMATRVGALDAGALIYILRQSGLSLDEIEHRLYETSGLLALSGISNDVETLLKSTAEKAKFALAFFAQKTAQYIAMMAVSMGGIDGLVFTGGIGEHATSVREAIMSHLSFMSIGQTLIIPANEEYIMAKKAKTLLMNKSLYTINH